MKIAIIGGSNSVLNHSYTNKLNKMIIISKIMVLVLQTVFTD